MASRALIRSAAVVTLLGGAHSKRLKNYCQKEEKGSVIMEKQIKELDDKLKILETKCDKEIIEIH